MQKCRSRVRGRAAWSATRIRRHTDLIQGLSDRIVETAHTFTNLTGLFQRNANLCAQLFGLLHKRVCRALSLRGAFAHHLKEGCRETEKSLARD